LPFIAIPLAFAKTEDETINVKDGFLSEAISVTPPTTDSSALAIFTIDGPRQDAAATAAKAVTYTAALEEQLSEQASKKAFVLQWATRIDAYLDGSPLAGQGETFALAAYTYGVDPRWSPAISTIESSKGAICSAQYNAWGWSGGSWSSWDEAIEAHVAGLAASYGAQNTLEAAKKYCPPSYENWYATVESEMAKI
jgi:hypothetical protein